MRMSIAQLLVRFLHDAGVRFVFGVSGHSIFDITDAIYAEPEIRYVPVQHELSAAYMADAYARATGQIGVCLATSGGGATNLITGIAQAYKESSPVLAIAADVSRPLSGKGASSWHETPQEEIFRPVTKMSIRITSAASVLNTLQEAHRIATTGRKGPVYVALPRDLQKEQVDPPDPPWTNGIRELPATDSRLIGKAAEELFRAAQPILIAGGGAWWSRAADEVQELAEWLEAPVGTTPSHKGLISERHRLSLGVLGTGASPFANQACLESDVILAVGTTFSEALTLRYGNRVIPDGANIIHVDIDPKEIGKIYSVHTGIVGDAKSILRELLVALKKLGVPKSRLTPRLQKIAAEKRQWQEELARRGRASEGPIDQWHVYAALRKALRDDAVVVGEGGTVELLRRFTATARVYHSGDFRAIGCGLSLAIGLKFASPEKQVVCVSGDGSFMMEMQELATAMAQNLPIVVIIIRNSAYGNMKRDQLKHYGGRVIGTDLYLPDFRAFAASFGAHTERVEKPSELLDSFQRALNVEKPSLIDVVCPIEGV